MNIVNDLVCEIEDEIKGIECYSKLALKYKIDYPEEADIFHQLSIQEDEHYQKLHSTIESVIKQVKQEGKTVPEGMSEMYKFLHERYISEYEKALRFQQMYKK